MRGQRGRQALGGDPIRVELPAIREAWKETACTSWHSQQFSTHAPRQKRQDAAVGALKMVRCLLSIEEVFGKGLLEKFNASQPGDF